MIVIAMKIWKSYSTLAEMAEKQLIEWKVTKVALYQMKVEK
jgi:hypothetical protein